MSEQAPVAERHEQGLGQRIGGLTSLSLLTRVGRSKWTAPIGAALIYALWAVHLTWPLVTDMNHIIFGAYGDLTGSIAGIRELVEHHMNPFVPGTIHDLSAPDGQPVQWPQNIASFSSISTLYVLTAAFGSVAAFGIFVLVGFVTTGTSMFLLVRKLTGSAWIALLIGWAYAFYPFAVVKAGGHVHFVHGWVLVLILWRMLELYERPTVRNGVFAGLAGVLAVSWSPYYLLIAGIEYGVLFVAGLIQPLVKRTGDFRLHLRAQVVGGAIILGFAVALDIIASLSVRGTGVAPRNIQALYIYSARPLEYVVPPLGNMLVGHTTGPFLAARLHGSNFAENTLYVGISLIALACVTLVSVAIRRQRSLARPSIVITVAAMGAVALLWSAPPKVAAFGRLIPFPSLITFHISADWRVYARFVMVVMLAVCVLAAFGLALLTKGRRPALQAAILVAIGAIVYVDLDVPPVGTNHLHPPPIYRVIKAMPPGIVADYPLEPNGYGDYSTEFAQDWIGHPVVNGYPQGSLAETRALELARLADPKTPGRLAALGVRYVLDDHVPIEQGVTPPGKPGRGLRFVKDDGNASLWRVVAKPLPLITLGPGFDPLEGPTGAQSQWLAANNGDIELLAPCSSCSGSLVVNTWSLARPRTLTLVGPDGRPVASRRVGTAKQTVAFPLTLHGRQTYTFRTSPGPESVHKATGAPDSRSLSVSVTNARLVLNRSR